MDNLVKKAQNRDADAFIALMQSQMQNMYKTARAILSNDEDVADAVSETILVCWEKLEQLKEPAYFRTWMTRILINKCRDHLRSRENLSFTGELPETPAQDTGFDNVEWNEALQSLDDRYRLVLMLYYVEGYKTAEISQILEIPESTVRTRLSRGREKLALGYGAKQKGGAEYRNSSGAGNDPGSQRKMGPPGELKERTGVKGQRRREEQNQAVSHRTEFVRRQIV